MDHIMEIMVVVVLRYILTCTLMELVAVAQMLQVTMVQLELYMMLILILTFVMVEMVN